VECTKIYEYNAEANILFKGVRHLKKVDFSHHERVLPHLSYTALYVDD